MKSKKNLTENEIKANKIRKIVIWSIIAVAAICIIAYCISNPGEISKMTGGSADGVIN